MGKSVGTQHIRRKVDFWIKVSNDWWFCATVCYWKFNWKLLQPKLWFRGFLPSCVRMTFYAILKSPPSRFLRKSQKMSALVHKEWNHADFFVILWLCIKKYMSIWYKAHAMSDDLGGGLGGDVCFTNVSHTLTTLLLYLHMWGVVLFTVFLKKRDGGDFEFPRKLIPRGSSRKPLNHILGCSNFWFNFQ